MKSQLLVLVKLIVGSYFLLLFIFGLSGYIGKGHGFKTRSAFSEKFGPKVGTFIHFAKAVILPLILGLMLVSQPLLDYFGLS
mgnify:FL=1|tara:strand:- start:9 stop:254 length:246 start_codon:yes stop_codon:yes gene_type:complete